MNIFDWNGIKGKKKLKYKLSEKEQSALNQSEKSHKNLRLNKSISQSLHLMRMVVDFLSLLFVFQSY